MTHKNAQQRYMKVFIPVMILYAASCFVVPALLDLAQMPKALVYMLALIPAVCIGIGMWSQWRFSQEVDEYWRSLLSNAALIGLAFVMCVSAAWGFLEFFADAPHVSLFFVVPAFYGAFGIAHGVLAHRMGRSLSIEGEV